MAGFDGRTICLPKTTLRVRDGGVFFAAVETLTEQDRPGPLSFPVSGTGTTVEGSLVAPDSAWTLTL